MEGSVISRDNGGVTIALYHTPDDACSACGLGDSCSLPKTEKIHVDISDQTRDLKINDRVDVEIAPRKIVGLSALVYIFPLILMLAGALLGASFSEIASMLGAAAGLAMGFIINIKLDKFLKISNIIIIRRLS